MTRVYVTMDRLQPNDLDDAYSGHCQVDVERTGSAADEAMTQPSDLDTRHLTPDPEGTCAQQAMVDGSQQVTPETEQIQHDAVHR